MLSRIPAELRALPQWVGVDMRLDPATGAPAKIPLNPRTGAHASPTDAESWGTFEEACAQSERVGFVLTADDPYCFIDLDFKPGETPLEITERLSKIANAFRGTYIEKSVSGNGLHIICRAKLGAGRRRDNVEVYTEARYMIMTGDVWNGAPITNQQKLCALLYNEMAPAAARGQLVEIASDIPDEEILRMASSAKNATKFNALWAGQFADFPSQSEADFSLLSMLAFYTRSNEQVIRLFHQSGLDRPKAHRRGARGDSEYLRRALERIRREDVHNVDLSLLLASLRPPELEEVPELAQTMHTIRPIPPAIGLLGELAAYIYTASNRPVREYSTAAAVAILAGILGRSHNCSGYGLQQYVIGVGGTGSGKEDMATAVDVIFAAVRKTVPSADTFVGPGVFASGQALFPVLQRQPCFVSVLGEFGITLHAMCDRRASHAQQELKRLLLDLFGKSGFHKSLKPTAHANSEKDSRLIQAPNMTLLCDTTPKNFYDGLDVGSISEGLLPRFLTVENFAKRPPRNTAAWFTPPEDLIEKIADLCVIALQMQSSNTVAHVGYLDAAKTLLDDFDVECDNLLNDANQDIERELWNRAHLKALKLAALSAAADNPHDPRITCAHAEWAVEMVRRDVETVLIRFHAGEVGQGEHRQEADLRFAIAHYWKMTARQRRAYRVPEKLCAQKVIPYVFLRRWLKMRISFASDRRGHAVALDSLLKAMVKAGQLRRLNEFDARAKFGVCSECYTFGESW